MSPVKTWYVVHTQPNAERKAVSHLQRQGFSTYLPVYRKQRRHARRTEVVIAPVFPRYLFVAIDRAVQGWRCIQSTVGVSRLVCNGDEPAPIGHCIIEELRAREDERGLVQIAQRKFIQGEKVKVADGAFASCVGLFERVTDNERVAILLDLLGRKVRVILGADELTAA
jgi:transcriptional antiterminator RfaH